MDVTKSNFAEQLPRVRAAISRCSFMAMDCEYSGMAVNSDRSCPYDTPEELYVILKEDTGQFIIVQFGLSIFTLEADKERYKQETFNFYVFPSQYHQLHNSVLCQPSSLEFLVNRGLDFNRLFVDGVPYLRPAQVDSFRKDLEGQLQKLEDSTASSDAAAKDGHLKTSYLDFLNTTVSQIHRFLESSEEYIDFVDLTRFQRKLIYDFANSRISTPLDMETIWCTGERYILRVRRLLGTATSSGASRQQRLAQRVDDATGFSHVINAISKSGKPLVGHGLTVDLIHVINQFVCPLPATFAEFKTEIARLLPCVVDTKVMASMPPFRRLVLVDHSFTELHELECILGRHPFGMPRVVTAKASRPADGMTMRRHEEHGACQGALAAAHCFSAMLSYLGSRITPNQALLEPTADVLQPFANKVFPLTIAKIPYLNLAGDDVILSHDNTFHITFPVTWSGVEISHQFGGYKHVQRLKWIDGTSAFVTIASQGTAQARLLLQSTTAADSPFKVTQYNDWKRAQNQAEQNNA